jgi:DNA-binding MarR family transcriptional regulator
MARANGGADTPLNEVEMAAWRTLIRAHNQIVRRLEADLEAEHGLSLPAYGVLVHLSEQPDRRTRMSELAVHAVLTPSGLTRLVDKLAREGLVERQRCDSDARVVYAHLTDLGLQRLRTAYPTHLRGVREYFMDWLAPDQQVALAGALGPILDTCKEAETACVEAFDEALAADA